MSDIKTIDNFVDIDDCNKAIAVIDDLMLSVDKKKLGRIDDDRFVFFRPTAEDAVDFVKKYSKKALEEMGNSELYPHDVIFVKSEPGSEVYVHMDFENMGRCDKCTTAVVFYLNRDYSGGELYFPKLEESYSPEAGTVAIFPQNNEMYVHGANKIISGDKYIVNICLTTDSNRQYNMYK